MAAPDPNLSSMPAQAVTAVLMGWSEADGEMRTVAVDTNGKLATTATVSSGDAPATGTITSVNDAAASTTILASNANRKGATVFNDSTSILYLALSNTTASTTVYSVQVPAGGYYELPVCDCGVYTGILVGIWSADASGAARITELT